MWGKKLWLFPVAVFICIPSTFIVSYIVAVSNGHVEPGFPYISDTGTYPPESCIFGQLLNMSAVLGGITIYIRYRDVEETLLRREIIQRACMRLSRLNNFGLGLGILSALGASIVANFQETNVLPVHLIGAFLTFGLGAVYCWFQTYITYKMTGFSLKIAHIRLFNCIVISVFFIVLLSTSPVAMDKFSGNNSKIWTPDDGGYPEHIVSTASEWAMAIAMMFYFLTFVKEFRNFGMRCPTYYRHSEIQVTPGNSGQIILDNSTASDEPAVHIKCDPSEKTHSNGSLDRIVTV